MAAEIIRLDDVRAKASARRGAPPAPRTTRIVPTDMLDRLEDVLVGLRPSDRDPSAFSTTKDDALALVRRALHSPRGPALRTAPKGTA